MPRKNANSISLDEIKKSKNAPTKSAPKSRKRKAEPVDLQDEEVITDVEEESPAEVAPQSAQVAAPEPPKPETPVEQQQQQQPPKVPDAPKKASIKKTKQ